MAGFERLRYVGDIFSVLSNSLLRSLPDFDELDSIGRMSVTSNANLVALPAFEALRDIEGQLWLQGNTSLRLLPDFVSLRSVGRGVRMVDAPIHIRGNTRLAVCCGVFAFVQESVPDGYELGGTGVPTIDNNASGCNSVAELRVPARCLLEGAVIGNIVLDSLEAITSNIRAATRIVGNLTIGDGEAGNDITNTELARLQVEEITGDLLIQATKLTSLTAFSELRRVGRDFYIGGNNSSDGNAMLGTLSGLNALEHVGRDLVVDGNTELTTATGFERLDSIGRRLDISNNRVLRSLPDFRRLRIIGTSLGLGGHNELTSLPAFPALISIGSGALSFDTPISIELNPSLATCCGVFPFVQSPLPDGFTLGGTGRAAIAGNAAGCNSVAEVRESECYLTVTTMPSLLGLPQAGGTVTVELSFIGYTTGWRTRLRGSLRWLPSNVPDFRQ